MNQDTVEKLEGVPKSTAEFFTDVRCPYVRSSPMEDFKECPRKFLYRYRLGITPRRYEGALFMGQIVHILLQRLVLGASTDEAMVYAGVLREKEGKKLADSVGPGGFLSGGSSLEAALKKLDEDYHKARAMALVFWQFRPFNHEEWDILKAPDGTPMVEKILTVDIVYMNTDPDSMKTVPFRVPCDLVLVKKGTQEVWIWDYKTTSFDPKTLAIPTQFSPQLQLYRMVLQTQLDEWGHSRKSKYPDYPWYTVTGSIHAFLKKPTIKFCPNTKDKAGFHSYIERLVQWYKDEETKNPQNPPLILDPHRFHHSKLSGEFEFRLSEYFKARLAPPDIDRFYRAGGHTCFQFNRVCPYVQLCNSDPVMWPDIVRSTFDIRFREDEENTKETT